MSLIFFFHTVDDAYIYGRIAHNLADGNGPVFNIGEAVDAGAGMGWYAIMSIADLAGIDSVFAAKIMGVIFHTLTAGITCYVIGWLGIALALDPSHAFWSSSGLETPAFNSLLIVAALMLLPKPDSTVKHRTSWFNPSICNIIFLFLLSILPWIRPEGLAFFLAGIYFYYRKEKNRNSSLKLTGLLSLSLLTALMPFGLRLWMTGRFLPHPYILKMGPFDLGTFWLAINYFKVNTPIHWLIAASAALYAFFGSKKKNHIQFYVPVLFSIILVLLTIRAGWDWMGKARLILPLYPLFLIIVYSQVKNKSFRIAQTIIILSALSGTLVSLPSYIQDAKNYQSGLSEAHIPMADYLKDLLKEGDSIALEDAGIIPYMLPEAHIIDMIGLANPHFVNLPGFWAQTRFDADWVMDQKPRFIIIISRNSGSKECILPVTAISKTIQKSGALSTYRQTKVLRAFHEYYLVLFEKNDQ